MTIREILNMLKWHPDYDFNRVSIIYIDRPKGHSELNAKEIEDIGYKFIYLKDDEVIPVHRIVEIKYKDEIFWRKRDERDRGRSCEKQIR